jgi:predicted transposase YdaD
LVKKTLQPILLHGSLDAVKQLFPLNFLTARVVVEIELMKSLAEWRQTPPFISTRGFAMTINHDRLFKELLNTFFMDFIELFLPEMALYIDSSSLQFLDKEIFSDVTAGDTHEVDLLVKAKFKGSESFFVVHVETQSDRQPKFDRRLYGYFARLYEKYDLPIYPVAVLSFDQPRTKQPCAHEVHFPDLAVLQFRYALIQLNCLDWRQYLKLSNPVAAALMAKMNIAQEDRPKVQLECLRMLATLKLDPARTRLISGFINTYLQLTAAEMKQHEQEFKALSRLEREAVMEITTSWKEEGLKEGRELGRKEGQQEGRQQEALELVSRQLKRRLGMIEASLFDQVEKLARDQLELLSENLLDFATVADLQQWLAAQNHQ